MLKILTLVHSLSLKPIQDTPKVATLRRLLRAARVVLTTRKTQMRTQVTAPRILMKHHHLQSRMTTSRMPLSWIFRPRSLH